MPSRYYLAVYARETVGQRARGQGEATAAERGGEFGRVRAHAFLHLLRGFKRGEADHRELLPRHRLAEEDGGSFGEHDGRSEVVRLATINTMDVQQHGYRFLWVHGVLKSAFSRQAQVSKLPWGFWLNENVVRLRQSPPLPLPF